MENQQTENNEFVQNNSSEAILALGVLGNIIWLVFGGLISALTYFFLGCALCITIIGIPLGLQAFKLATLALWPFNRQIIFANGQLGCLSMLFNIIWLILFGWELFLAHAFIGILLCCSIVGIPFGLQQFKLARLSLLPFGSVITLIR